MVKRVHFKAVIIQMDSWIPDGARTWAGTHPELIASEQEEYNPQWQYAARQGFLKLYKQHSSVVCKMILDGT